ncbi:MAG: PD40 domain-containing protein [Bacteroidales bacterium]|nr:PD40 domain-containing protein [Bacteroidales bacterium]
MPGKKNHRFLTFVLRITLLSSSLFLLPSSLFPPSLHAQFYNGSQLTFGKSRVQFNDFFWTYFRFDKFDTYFYLNGRELAEFTAEYADQHIRKIELTLQSGLEDKIQFIIFNNLSDLKQSNIGLYGDWDTYNTGGVTRIIGGRVLLYFDGDYGHFEEQIRAGIASVILNQMMYGTGIGAQIKNTALFNMPEWYMGGLISYISSGWDTELDNIVRDAMLSGRYKKFNRLSGKESVWAGQSLWHYITVRYGESAIPNIVYMARMSRNIEKGFLYVLGLPYKTLLNDWLAYYTQLYTSQDAGRINPDGRLLNRKNKPDRLYRQLKLSPDGRYLAYATHQLGVYKVFLMDTESGRKHRIFRGGYRLAEHPDYSFPILAWHPSGEILAILTERKGESWLYFYELEEKRKAYQVLYNFQKILDISYSGDGRYLAFSAVQKGQSDLFVFDIAAGSHDQLTNDIYDDFSPRFLPGSAEIIFSSNRVSDTVRFYEKVDINRLTFNNDIFIYKYAARSPILKRITNTPFANEIQPFSYADNFLCYLSDANGIYNRYVARFDSAIVFIDTTTHYRYFTSAFPVTNYKRSIVEQDVSLPAARIGEVVTGVKNSRMYLMELVRPSYLSAASLEPTNFMAREMREAEIEEAISRGDSTFQVPKEVIREQKSHFRTVRLSDLDTAYLQRFRQLHGIVTTAVDSTGTVVLFTPAAQDSVNKYKKAKALNYNVEYAIDEMVTQIDFTYLNTSYQPFSAGTQPVFINPGLNVLFMMGVTDLMEDYRITGGVRLNFDLVNNEYIFSFGNFKRRLDHQILYHRVGVDDFGYYSYIRHKVNELYYIATYPLTPVLSIRGTASVRYDRAVYLSTDQVNLQEPDDHKVWGSIKGELTYDNTRNYGVNLYYGTRYKIFGEYYQLVNRNGTNVVVLGLDFRHYQKLHRTMIWANRIAASTSFGSNKLVYYMGGVDNWLWPRFDMNTPVAFDQNYVFQTLATNMRGFNQNIRNGNSFFVINSEIRMPVFRYFFNRPIRSDFLNNFQIVAFGDLGTAWTGSNPWSKDNQLFRQYIYRNPLFIQVEMIKDPLVGGFGGGLRSRLLGYFIRADLAWGIEDGRVRKPIFYFSLSLDF